MTLVLCFLGATLWTTARESGSVQTGAYIALAGVAALSYLFLRAKYAHIADEVLDFGSHLLVKRSGDCDRIALADIKDARTLYRPLRIELDLVKRGCFGEQITFLAHFSLRPWREDLLGKLLFVSNWLFYTGKGEHPLVNELLNRAYAARCRSDAVREPG